MNKIKKNKNYHFKKYHNKKINKHIVKSFENYNLMNILIYNL